MEIKMDNSNTYVPFEWVYSNTANVEFNYVIVEN